MPGPAQGRWRVVAGQGLRADAPAAARLPLIDAARGIAIAAMVVYHFSWDLRHFGYITADVTEDPGWRMFARAIAGSFLFIVGISLVLASRRGFRPKPFLRRLALIVAAAAAVTLVTYLAFPDSYVFFGILHHIALASVLGLGFVSVPLAVVVAAAIGCFLAPVFLAGPAFDSPALLWLGLASYFPRTNDFVPIFPWFGVVLAGIAVARAAQFVSPAGAALATLQENVPVWLSWAGRHSLVIYLLHQPVLFGLVFIAAQVAPPSLAGFEPSFIDSCTATCVESEVEPDACRRTCQCIADRSETEGLWSDLVRETLDQAQAERYFELSDECRATAGQ
jgi:uncharacterized membrane protein